MFEELGLFKLQTSLMRDLINLQVQTDCYKEDGDKLFSVP